MRNSLLNHESCVADPSDIFSQSSTLLTGSTDALLAYDGDDLTCAVTDGTYMNPWWALKMAYPMMIGAVHLRLSLNYWGKLAVHSFSYNLYAIVQHYVKWHTETSCRKCVSYRLAWEWSIWTIDLTRFACLSIHHWLRLHGRSSKFDRCKGFSRKFNIQCLAWIANRNINQDVSQHHTCKCIDRCDVDFSGFAARWNHLNLYWIGSSCKKPPM